MEHLEYYDIICIDNHFLGKNVAFKDTMPSVQVEKKQSRRESVGGEAISG